HHSNRREARSKEIRSLCFAGTDQQPPVASPLNRQFFRLCVLVSDEPFRSGNEVIKNVLLVQFGPGEMPLFAVFPTSSQVRQDKYPPHFHPRQPADGEGRSHGDRKPTIAVQQRRTVSIERNPLLVRDEER